VHTSYNIFTSMLRKIHCSRDLPRAAWLTVIQRQTLSGCGCALQRSS